MQNALQMKTGTVTGDLDAVLTVTCGFIPRKIIVTNLDHGHRLEWNDSMGAGDGIFTAATGASTVITSGAITVGTRTTLLGFTIGVGATSLVNLESDVLRWEAYE